MSDLHRSATDKSPAPDLSQSVAQPTAAPSAQYRAVFARNQVDEDTGETYDQAILITAEHAATLLSKGVKDEIECCWRSDWEAAHLESSDV